MIEKILAFFRDVEIVPTREYVYDEDVKRLIYKSLLFSFVITFILCGVYFFAIPNDIIFFLLMISNGVFFILLASIVMRFIYTIIGLEIPKFDHERAHNLSTAIYTILPILFGALGFFIPIILKNR